MADAMAVKYTREDIRERPGQLTGPRRRMPERSSKFRMFLFLYIGVGAYIVIALFLQSIMGAIDPIEKKADAVVIERTAEAGLLLVRLEIRPKADEAFVATAEVSEDLYSRALPGTPVYVRYRKKKSGEGFAITDVGVTADGSELSTDEGSDALFETIPLR